MLQTEVWKNVNSPVNQKPSFCAASGWGAIFESAAFKLNLYHPLFGLNLTAHKLKPQIL